MKRLDAVLLLSSGLDSAAQFVLAKDFSIKAALTIDYGQKSAECELACAKKLAKYFKVEHLCFEMKQFSSLIDGKSALLGSQEIPEPVSLNDLKITEKTARAVWVPNRNGVFLSIAAAFAESRGLNAVAVGFNAEEAVTFPDNTQDYMAAMTESFKFSTLNQVKVVGATSNLTKAQIVAKLSNTDFPFELLWSCYHTGSFHCGKCESCQRLKRALKTSLPSSKFTNVAKLLFETSP